MILKNYTDFINESKEIQPTVEEVLKKKGCYLTKDGLWNCDKNLNIGSNKIRYVLLDKKTKKLKVKFGEIKGDFTFGVQDTGGMYPMTGMEGLPHTIHGYLSLSRNNITHIDDNFPKFIGGKIKMDMCGLTSLVGLPDYINGSLEVQNNKLTSLEGIPRKIDGDSIYLHKNPLQSLEGIPKNFNGHWLSISSTYIKDLMHVPDNVEHVEIEKCTKLETIKHIIGKKIALGYYRAPNRKTKIVELEVKAYKNIWSDNDNYGEDNIKPVDIKSFYNALIKIMVEERYSIEDYNWPENIEEIIPNFKNFITSLKGINKFKL